MTRERILKFGWIAPLFLLLGVALFLMRGKEPQGESKSRSVRVRTPLPDSAGPTSEDARNGKAVEPRGSRTESLASERSGSSTDEERSAADVIAADPLKATLKHAFTRFSMLKSYSYAISVKVYQEGRPILETTSMGRVKDQEIVMGVTEIQGEVFEVASRGAESRIRRLGEAEWGEAESGWYEAGEVDPRAADMAAAWADPVLASMPLESAPDETVGGVRCRAVRLNLEGGLPGGESSPSGRGACAVTFGVDDDGYIRRWRLTMDLVQDGKKLKTCAEADFSGFDETWTHPLPEWMQ